MDEQPGAMPSSLWTYRARALAIIDGDTVDVTVDAGFRNYRDERVRLLGVNAPEMKGATLAAARAARDYVHDWLADAAAASPLEDWPLVIRTQKSDAFGRFLADVWRCSDGRSLNADLLAAGHAVPYTRSLPGGRS